MRTFFHTYDLIPRVKYLSLILIVSVFHILTVIAAPAVTIAAEPAGTVVAGSVSSDQTVHQENVKNFCVENLKKYKSFYKENDLEKICAKALVMDGCKSVQGSPIFHFNQTGAKKEKSKNILVISLIHGDEGYAGTLGRYWIERLDKIDPRNNWRVIPILNPDGTKKNTRANANGVDLNRNFPTKDWDEKALEYWKKEAASSSRKFPGNRSGSEPEVNCALKHIHDFKPDFVMSIHTPLKVLDFDGPKVRPPPYKYLPWRRLGNFPGSLGRYLWVEQNIPVLTTELDDDAPSTSSAFDQLQDLIGELVQKDLK